MTAFVIALTPHLKAGSKSGANDELCNGGRYVLLSIWSKYFSLLTPPSQKRAIGIFSSVSPYFPKSSATVAGSTFIKFLWGELGENWGRISTNDKYILIAM